MRPRTIWLMAISVGVIVANIYYAQPLLADIARDLHFSVPTAGLVAMLCQIGTVAGMLLFVPLGDTHERRGLITKLLLGAAVSLIAFAIAPSVAWLALAALAVGLFGATVHVIVPYAAHLAPDEQRGRVLGFIFSGLLMGILLARTFSGFVGAQFGWRSVFWIGALAMLILGVLIRWQLPPSDPELKLTWRELVSSSWGLVRDHAALRESALAGALGFAAFSAFWTTLVFRLGAPPFHYGSRVAGLFGLVGAAGALGAPIVGHMADRRGPRDTVMVALAVGAMSFLVMGVWGSSFAGLIVGVILLDLGVQSAHVSNQTRIYAIDPAARSRLNMVYMVCYFSGGALGSYAGAHAWQLLGWRGVCGFGASALGAATLLFTRGRRSNTVTPSAVA